MQQVASFSDLDKQDESFQSLSSSGPNYRKSAIVFAEAGSQLKRLYQIYKDNDDKMKILNNQNDELQKHIVQIEHLNRESSCIINLLNDSCEEEVQLSRIIQKYDSKRGNRQKQIASLQYIYQHLKRLTFQQNMLSNDNMNNILSTWIRTHRKVVSYKSTTNHVVILSFERKKSQSIYTIRLINKSYLLRKLKTKSASIILIANEHDLLEINQQDSQNLQEKVSTLEMEINIMKLITISYQCKTSLQLCIFSQKLNQFFIYEEASRIIRVNWNGTVVDSIQLDAIDTVILLEQRQNQLLIGTNQGIVRVYSISDKMQLNSIYSCLLGQIKEIDLYYLPEQTAAGRIYFISDSFVYQFDRTLLKTTKIIEIKAAKCISTLGNYLIDKDHIYCIACKSILSVNVDKFEISEVPKLEEWYSNLNFRKESIQKTIIEIQFCSQTQQYSVIVADNQGSISLIHF